MRWTFLSLLLGAGCLAGCAGSIEVDAGNGGDAGLDAGAPEDAGRLDGAADADEDAGALEDAGRLDGAADAGEDAGTLEDAGRPDGAADAGADLDPGATLLERLSVADVTAPAGVKAGVTSWRIWGLGSLHVAPVFTVPLANCETLVGYTTSGGGPLIARAARLDPAGGLVQTHELGSGYELRGLAAEPDGHFAALLWDDGADAIFVRRFDPAGTEVWTAELVNADNRPDDFGIGDSRLEYGDGRYGAYYHVHSDSGHEGDTLKWAQADSGSPSTGWTWGCSHSMSNLLRHNPGLPLFLPVCVTDCYPGTSGDFATNSRGGIYLNHRGGWVMDVDAGCNGSVAGEIGSAALAPAGWALVFNAHQNPMTPGQSSYDPSSMNQDIGFATVDAGLDASAVVWLTDTPGVNEADSSIARWQPAGDGSEQFVAGWAEPGSPYVYRLARVDANGAFLEGPVDVSSRVQWGRRDDPFRTHVDGDVVWAWFDAPGSTTLHFARLDSGRTATCADF